MFKNLVIKRMLKNSVFKVATVLNCIVPKNQNKILLYSSNRGINNNLGAIKQYLIDNKYYEKYSIICGIESNKYIGNDTAYVRYCPKIKAYIQFFTSRFVFYTNGQIPIRPSSKQTVIHLDHGTANFKNCGHLLPFDNGCEFYFTYYLAPSEEYRSIVMKEYMCKSDNIKICGEAVTDVMFKEYEHYNLGNFDKVILWTPTFRQSDYYGHDDSSELLIPMFEESDYEELNAELKKYNFRLIVKLHAGQDLSKYKKLMYSNLELYSDSEFQKKGWDLYCLMPQVDYMIGDYSSTCLQFLLLDKPLAYVIPDFDEYSEKRGFVFDNPKEYMPGDLVTTKKELYKVFKNWSEGQDIYVNKRKIVRDKIHYYKDGNNAKRALEIAGIVQVNNI